jgi:hypothetical protein
MSGGHYDYAYRHVEDFTESLESDIDANEYGFGPETLVNLKAVLLFSKMAADLMQEAEWLFSFDNSEESFNRIVVELKDKYAPLFDELISELSKIRSKENNEK